MFYCIDLKFYRTHLSLSSSSAGNQAPGPSSATMLPKGLSNKAYNLCTTKIVKAEKKMSGGKVEFIAQEATYVELKPATANVKYILNYIQKIWGPDYIIVSNDGLQIHDCPATKG